MYDKVNGLRRLCFGWALLSLRHRHPIFFNLKHDARICCLRSATFGDIARDLVRGFDFSDHASQRSSFLDSYLSLFPTSLKQKQTSQNVHH